MGELFDYHMHTYLCGHAVGSAEEYVLAAIQGGLVEVGFAEHIPMYWLPPAQRDPTIAMPEESFEGYVRTVLDLRDAYPEITVRLGVEADYVPGHEDRLEAILAPYPWDYVYGSVHYVDGWGFDNPAYKHRYMEWQIETLYERYFALMIDAAQTGIFDVLGHLDVIKKWGHRPASPPTELYRTVALELAKCGVPVEVNSAGYRRACAELYPGPELLVELLAAGVPFTLGSDAHMPKDVGRDLDAAVRQLRAAGCESLVQFDERRRSVVPLPGA
ncbi:MAG: histidinol-phosphatase HisJ family protein [Chloroflexia bacterium]|nr:histidinol-phosphatase HisJ family protein [Chloroflexia bacterium]